MKLSERTRKILNNFNDINDSILFVEGKIQRTMPLSKTMLAVAELDEEFPKEFGVFYFSKFMQILSMFKDPDLSFDTTKVTFTEDSVNATYTYCDAKLIKVTPPKGKDVTLSNVKVSFTLSEEIFAAAKKAGTVLGNKDLVVSGDGSKMLLSVKDTKNNGADTYSREIGTTTENFSYVFDLEDMKILPSNYDISIDDRGMSRWISQSWGVSYFIATQK